MTHPPMCAHEGMCQHSRMGQRDNELCEHIEKCVNIGAMCAHRGMGQRDNGLCAHMGDVNIRNGKVSDRVCTPRGRTHKAIVQ